MLARDVSIATGPPTATSVLHVLPARVQALQEGDASTTLVRLELAAPPGQGQGQADALLTASRGAPRTSWRCRLASRCGRRSRAWR